MSRRKFHGVASLLWLEMDGVVREIGFVLRKEKGCSRSSCFQQFSGNMSLSES